MDALTPAQLHAWFDATFPGRDWLEDGGQCQAVAVNAADATGGYIETYPTAKAAAEASGWLNPDPSTAPAGACHYFDIPHPSEHVAIDLLGGGKLLLQALGVADDWWGDGLGTMSFARLRELRPQWSYLGWSRNNGRNVITIQTTGTAGGDTTPFEEDDDMSKVQYVMITDDKASDLGVAAGDWWCRSTPTGYLERLTAGQAYDALRSEKLESGPFAIAPERVTAKGGEWLRAALEEDKIAHELTRRAHGWPPSVGLGDDSDDDLAARLDEISKRLSAQIDDVPAEVVDELAKRLSA